MSNKEIWKWVVGYEGLYMISNYGRVMSAPRPTHYGQVLSQRERPIGSGYLTVCLSKNNEKHDVSVHRLVAQAFVSNPQNKPEVNHINGNRSDNRADNLEWVTRSENEKHAYRMLGKRPNKPWAGKPRKCARRFSDDQIRAIRADDRPCRVIAEEYGVTKTAIRDIKIRKNYNEVV